MVCNHDNAIRGIILCIYATNLICFPEIAEYMTILIIMKIHFDKLLVKKKDKLINCSFANDIHLLEKLQLKTTWRIRKCFLQQNNYSFRVILGQCIKVTNKEYLKSIFR